MAGVGSGPNRPTPWAPSRIAFGVLVVVWTLSLIPDLHEFFSADGIVPLQPASAYEWGVFEIWTDDRALVIGWALLLVSAMA